MVGHWTDEKINKMKNSYAKTMLSRYGASNYWKTKNGIEKIRKTCQIKYGTPFPMQNSTIAYKSHSNRAKKKTYNLPSGKQIYLRGYEPQFLKVLLSSYNESDIITDIREMDVFWYIYNNKIRRYYPDFLIKDKNQYFEIKSKYTYENDVERCNLKCESVKNKGYNISLLVLDIKGNILLTKKY